jgi:peptide/nickel transport system substrate-binding protein
MKSSIKKSGQKIIRKLSRTGRKTTEKSKAHIKQHIFSRIGNIRTVRLWVLEWMLLVIVIILFAVIQSIWYRNSYETEVFVSGGAYSEGTIGTINSMNPLYASTSSERTLSKLLFSSLVTPDTSGNLGNNLARSVRVDSTSKVWTVTLKDNIQWSDGQPITADDVVYTVDLIKNPTAKTTVAVNFANVKVERADERTVIFTLPTVYAAFTETLDFPIVPKHILGEIDPSLIYENTFSTHPTGSGPFILNAMQRTSQGQTVHLNRNTRYHASSPNLDSFILRTYNNARDIVSALNRAEITASADLSTLGNDTGITATAIYERQAPINAGVFAFLNTSSQILSDTRVRQAIQRGINMDAIRQGIVEDQALDYPILARQMDLKFPELPKHDPEAAQKLLSSAGYKLNENNQLANNSGATASLSLSVLSTGVLPQLAERLAEQLTALGFEVIIDEFVAEEASQDFFTAIIRPRNYDVLIYEIDLGLDPDPFAYFNSAAATSTGMNLSNYRNVIVDDLLLSARTTMNPATRQVKYETFLKYWVNDAPTIGIYQSALKYYYTRNTRIFSENSILPNPLDRFSDVTYWATEKATRNRTP